VLSVQIVARREESSWPSRGAKSHEKQKDSFCALLRLRILKLGFGCGPTAVGNIQAGAPLPARNRTSLQPPSWWGGLCGRHFLKYEHCLPLAPPSKQD